MSGKKTGAGPTPDKRSGWKKIRFALSRATSKAIREPLRRVREPLRQIALKFIPGYPIVIEQPETLPLAPFTGVLPQAGTRCLVYEDAPVVIRSHPLSRHSSEDESRHYLDHIVTAPGLTLESPGPHFWFARSGLMVSPKGGIWRHSFMAPFRMERVRTVKSISRAEQGGGEGGLVFHPSLVRGAERIAGPHLVVAQTESPNFGHFLLDVVPLIHLGKEMGAPMLAWPFKPWQKDIIARIGVAPGQIRELPAKTHLLEQPVVSNRLAGLGAHIAHPMAKRVFDAIRDRTPVERYGSLPRRFFLMRGLRHGRSLKNRVELGEALASHGVASVQPELMSFEEQVALFARAELVVAEFGAAMANVVFCPAGAKVLEIISEGQHDPWSARLCGMLGLEHVVHFQKLSEDERLSRGDRFAPSPDFAFAADIAAICATVDHLR